MEVRKQQLEESQNSVEALQQSRLGPASRMQYYLKLIGEDLSKTPDTDTDFGDLPNQVEQPVDESGLKLIRYEKEEMDKADQAATLTVVAGVPKALASIFHPFPGITAAAEAFGVGVAAIFGGRNLGDITNAAIDVLQLLSSHMQHLSSQASRKAGFLRQLQDRVQQANNAGYKIKNIDKQILTQQIRINMAHQKITNQQKQIDKAQEVEDFLRNKYTKQELHSWMEGTIRALDYQAYTLAYDLGERAEKVLRFDHQQVAAGTPRSRWFPSVRLRHHHRCGDADALYVPGWRR